MSSAPGPVARLSTATATGTEAVGAALARLLRAGDLVVLSGDLGAGKTTLTRGLGAALGVRGAVTSPTFVIARVHPGPLPLVHVDAYRIGSALELDDLDLDASLDEAVTVVEWGAGLAEPLAADRLEVELRRGGGGDGAADERDVLVRGVGPRWAGIDLGRVLPPGQYTV